MSETQGRSGRLVESARGYAIREWTNYDGTRPRKPFTSSPAHSFDWTAHETLEAARAHVAAAPPLRTVKVSFEAYLPPGVDVDDERVTEWVEFELHANGSLAAGHPLMDHGLEAFDVVAEVCEVR